jgi:hypothetical protein
MGGCQAGPGNTRPTLLNFDGTGFDVFALIKIRSKPERNSFSAFLIAISRFVISLF